MPTPPDDILLNKAAVIERCIRRIRAEAAAAPLFDDFTHLDALTLNIERACQAAIDIAMHVVAERDHSVTATFAMYVLSMYAALQEARREVLRAYAA